MKKKRFKLKNRFKVSFYCPKNPRGQILKHYFFPIESPAVVFLALKGFKKRQNSSQWSDYSLFKIKNGAQISTYENGKSIAVLQDRRLVPAVRKR